MQSVGMHKEHTHIRMHRNAVSVWETDIRISSKYWRLPYSYTYIEEMHQYPEALLFDRSKCRHYRSQVSDRYKYNVNT